jgi:excisionase family DNA binding protein
MSLINGRPLLTVEEAADYLRCSPVTVRRLIAARRLASIKRSGDYSRTLIWAGDLETYLNRSRIGAVGEVT